MLERPEFIEPPDWMETGRGLGVAEAARYLGVSVSYLNKLRVFGGGPAYEKHGRRVVYTKRGLDAWRDDHRFTSTTEYRADGGANARAS